MATKLPYVNQPGSIVKILGKVKEAQTPDRFTADFLETKLGFRGGNFRQFIPLAKKLGLLNSDGTPTELYKKFRNHHTSDAAMAQALKAGYAEVFSRNEFANNLNKEQFKGLIVEITGLEATSRVVQLICATFEGLRKMANFDKKITASATDKEDTHKQDDKGATDDGKGQDRELDLNLSYTINLVLPKTDDPAVFNSIFRALRDNLLRK